MSGRRHRYVNRSSNPAVYTWPSRFPVKASDAVFLARLVNEHQPDVLIGNFEAVNLMMPLDRLMRIPVRVAWYHQLTDQHDLDFPMRAWKIRFLRLRRTLVYKLASYIVPVSCAASLDLQRRFRVREEKCEVLCNSSVDPTADRLPSSTVLDPRRIVCVGRLAVSKGQETVIRAAALLRTEMPDLRIDLIGSGPEEGHYRSLVKQLGAEEMVVFVGSLSHAEVMKTIRSAYISLVPSLTDNCPLVIIECLACGTPLIASRAGGIVELIRDGIDGFLHAKQNAEDWRPR